MNNWCNIHHSAPEPGRMLTVIAGGEEAEWVLYKDGKFVLSDDESVQIYGVELWRYSDE